MSHASDDSADPDLTPLLDLVLQLLMFFIINVNFVSTQVSDEVKLPSSETARPLDPADPKAIYVGQIVASRETLIQLPLDEKRHFRHDDCFVLIPTQPAMTLPQAKAWLKDRYEFLSKLTPEGKVDTIIHFRPDGDLPYGQVVTLMNHIKTAGFTQIKVYARIKKPEG